MSNTDSNSASSNPLFTTPHERREFPRARVKWRAAVQFSGITTDVTVMEISDVGFGFIGDIAYQIGAVLSFQLRMPDPSNGAQWNTVLGQAEVMSSVLSREGFRAGVLLKSINPAHQEMLKAWVKLRLHH